MLGANHGQISKRILFVTTRVFPVWRLMSQVGTQSASRQQVLYVSAFDAPKGGWQSAVKAFFQ
jgi:hypothetical protein